MSAGFHLYTSSSIEELAAQYVACREASPEEFRPSDLFATEEVIVPSRSMGKWLERCLADQGVMLANMTFTSFFAFFQRLLAAQSTQVQQALFDRDTLAWRIYGILEKQADTTQDEHDDAFDEFTRYIDHGAKDESRALRRFSLARQLAEQFDLYMTERPEMLARPKEGLPPVKDNFWSTAPDVAPGTLWRAQAALWKALCQDSDGGAMASPADGMAELLCCPASELPQGLRPVVAWGVSSLPLRQLALLKKLSLATPVHFFCLNPCDRLWPDGVRQAWSEGKAVSEPPALDALFDRTPLRQWATHEREFFRHLLGIGETETRAFQAPFEPSAVREWRKSSAARPLKPHLSGNGTPQEATPDGILQRLQANLRGQELPQGESQRDLSLDDTLTIHNCHNGLREVEVLHDHLLHLISTRHYSNSDILVAAPDISAFLPYIDAVFQQPVACATPPVAGDQSRKCRLAYSVCGRSVDQLNPLGDALMSLLDIGRSRYELSYVEKLLNCTEVRSRFGIGEEDIRPIVQWCREVGIRWGKDGRHKAAYGFPDFENFSWRHGVDRMLLGLAVNDDASAAGVWNAAAPYGICDYPDGRLKLQHLISFLGALSEAEERLATPCTPGEWQEHLNWLMDTFFQKDLERKTFYRGLWNAIRSLFRAIGLGGIEERQLPLEVVREAIRGTIGVADDAAAFLGGAITFCSLRDARGIPCRVLCLLGMDNGQYPRRPSLESMNLVREQLEAECRTVPQQDRYAFLESMLAARDCLLVYYRGQDDTSEEKYYPSTLVSDLRSYGERLVGKAGFSLEVKQSLLPYSHRYFNADDNGTFTLRDLWSYKREFRTIDAMYTENGEAVLDAFDIFGDAPEAVPAMDIEAAPKPPELPEVLVKQRDSFRNASLQTEASLEAARHQPVVVASRDLEAFLENGGFTFLAKGLRLPRQRKLDKLLEKSEPLARDSLGTWQILSRMNRWLDELLPQGTDVSDPNCQELLEQVLDQCYARLKAENLIPITANRNTLMEDFLEECWIQDKALCETWREQQRRENKRTVEIQFEDTVPLIPDCDFARLPECFDNLDAIPGNPYSSVEFRLETMKPKGVKHVYCALASSSSAKHRLRAWVRHLAYNADGDSVGTTIVGKDGKTENYAPLDQETACRYLRALLALYLYGRRRAVPLLCQCSVAAAKAEPDPEHPHKWATNYVSDRGGDIDLDYATMLWAQNLPDFRSQPELLDCIEALAKNVLKFK